MQDLQTKLDEKKWFDGIKNSKDMCGSYDYCCAIKQKKLRAQKRIIAIKK